MPYPDNMPSNAGPYQQPFGRLSPGDEARVRDYFDISIAASRLHGRLCGQQGADRLPGNWNATLLSVAMCARDRAYAIERDGERS